MSQKDNDLQRLLLRELPLMQGHITKMHSFARVRNKKSAAFYFCSNCKDRRCRGKEWDKDFIIVSTAAPGVVCVCAMVIKPRTSLSWGSAVC